MKDPKAILITGASSGLGKALAVSYATEGITLFLSGRSQERLNGVTELCRSQGANVNPKVIDVRDRNEMTNWIKVCDEQSSLDLVIANAGISGGTGGKGDGAEPFDQAALIFDINMGGVLNTIHPALNQMQKRNAGQVAMISSLAAFSGWPGAPAYSASKAAVRIYADALNGAMRRYNISVVPVCPGFIKTPMTDVNPYHMPFLMAPEKAALIIKRGLQKRKARIFFPFFTYITARFFEIIPFSISSILLRKMPAKPVNTK